MIPDVSFLTEQRDFEEEEEEEEERFSDSEELSSGGSTPPSDDRSYTPPTDYASPRIVGKSAIGCDFILHTLHTNHNYQIIPKLPNIMSTRGMFFIFVSIYYGGNWV